MTSADSETDALAAEEACAREPIHIPGSIQPHGVLFALGPDGTVIHVSENVGTRFGVQPEAAIGAPLIHSLPRDAAQVVGAGLDSVEPSVSGSVVARGLDINGTSYDVLVHRGNDHLIVEFEQVEGMGSLDTLYPSLRSFIEDLQDLPSVGQVTAAAARQVRELTGFDRVMIYQFDENWNGTVIAEARNDALPSYLDLRFPASDIPAQARELYRLNRLRIIPDADYHPVPIVPTVNPASGDPLDLSFAVLRSVAPVHLQYMRNMETPASMSISILEEGRLWGLISCHHSAPRRVPSHVRTACDFIGQMMAMQIGAKSRSDATAQRVDKHKVESRLLARMAAEPNFIDGLVNASDDLMAIADAHGAAIVWDDEVSLVGETPSRETVTELAGWLYEHQSHDGVFSTQHLAALRDDMAALAPVASGVMAISVSQLYPSYIIWFRPEMVQTVRWGGDPRKGTDRVTGRLNPRKSFDMWKETVSQRSLPWTAAQIDAAASLRNAIVGIVMRRAEEMAALTEELRRSNKELEAFSYSISHDLRAPFRHIVGFAELLKETDAVEGDARAARYIDTIIESAHSAGQLVDDLLGFSQMGRSRLNPVRLDMNKMVDDAMRTLHLDLADRDITWEIEDLAPAIADPSFMRSVWQNLVSNAIKYTRGTDPSVISISSVMGHEDVTYCVKDDGVGFDMNYVGKLFGVFQRLHRLEEYEGSGIGLANVKRIVERHGGRAWADGEVGKGASFSFTLPLKIEGTT